MEASNLTDLINIIDGDPIDINPQSGIVLDYIVDDDAFNYGYLDGPDYYPIDLPPKKKSRNTSKRVKYWSKGWGLMLLDPALKEPESREAKVFRRRFRVTYSIFLYIVDLCNQKSVFNTKRNYGTVPNELKVLIGLRILGRGNVADDIAEMSGVPPSSVARFFGQFVIGFCHHYFNEFVYFPEKVDELREITNLYAKLGLPGTCGSMDCTHITWHKCPKKMINSCKGREKNATIKFQVVCDHTRKILYCSEWFPGAVHDITVCRNDLFSKQCMDEDKLGKVEFILYDEYGRPRKCNGGHILVDEGYLKFACFICPQPHRCETSAVYWSE